MNRRPKILENVDRYYSAKLQLHGATAQGVDWNSLESQVLRFDQLLRIVDWSSSFSLNDYGCGYGELCSYLRTRPPSFDYLGCDVSASMIAEARRRNAGEKRCRFIVGDHLDRVATYTVASGVFNVRQDVKIPDWEAYLFDTLARLDASSARGFAFNCLTSYSDPERMKDNLYYADPCEVFDHCKCRYSRHVALLHDYGLYEFTILVKKMDP